MRKHRGDLVGAAAAYWLAIDSGHADQAPTAALNLEVLRQVQGDPPSFDRLTGHQPVAPLRRVKAIP